MRMERTIRDSVGLLQGPRATVLSAAPFADEPCGNSSDRGPERPIGFATARAKSMSWAFAGARPPDSKRCYSSAIRRLSARRLAQLAMLADSAQVTRIIEQLNATYDRDRSAYRIERAANGYLLLTRPTFAHWLGRVHHRQGDMKLSPPSLETLTVVAYRQPITRAEIEAVRRRAMCRDAQAAFGARPSPNRWRGQLAGASLSVRDHSAVLGGFRSRKFRRTASGRSPARGSAARSLGLGRGFPIDRRVGLRGSPPRFASIFVPGSDDKRMKDR